MAGLLLYYPFDEGAGPTANDLSTYARHGTITNCAWVAGRFGNALQFDSAADDHVDTPSFAFASLTNKLTFIGWLKCAEGADQLNVFNDNADNNPSFGISRNPAPYPDALLVEFYDAGGPHGWGTANFFTGYDNVWVHFAVVVDFTALTLDWYRNGFLIDHADGVGTWVFPNNLGAKRLGQWTDGTYKYKGCIDEFKVFDDCLTAAEVLQDYIAGPPKRPIYIVFGRT